MWRPGVWPVSSPPEGAAPLRVVFGCRCPLISQVQPESPNAAVTGAPPGRRWLPSGTQEPEGVAAVPDLRGQVAGVRRGNVHSRRHLICHGDAEPVELVDLVGIVGQQR